MPQPARVTIFVDYQNVYGTARSAFHTPDDPPQCGHIWPVALGQLIVGRRPSRSVLHQVRIYRGLPHPDREPTLHAINQRQDAVWRADDRVITSRRPLRYPSDWPASKAQEKGVDVALAVDLIDLTSRGLHDVAVVFSRDTDLLPALEAVFNRRPRSVHLEVASWKGTRPDGRPVGRLRFPNTNLPWCHLLDYDDYLSVQDSTNYRDAR